MSQPPPSPDNPPPLRPPAPARQICQRLSSRRDELQRMAAEKNADLAATNGFLAIAPEVRCALDRLTEQLFAEVTAVIEKQLTGALQEVLEQPIELKVQRSMQRGAASIEFHIERNGQVEDILRGQGGSVANILSVGLRLLALTTLDERKHRRFLVLDEQDCWLHPSLVPKLVKIVHDAGRALGFQVLMISHHDVAAFQQYADKLYRCRPTADGAVFELVSDAATKPDP